jgi:hypothetical protein
LPQERKELWIGAANQYFLAAESLGLENEQSSELMKVVERFSQPTDFNES